MPDLSVVIVNYNTRDKLKACLESLLRARGDLALELIVVDNGSKDGSQAMLRDYFADTVTLVEPGRNTWFTGGNNIGIRHATSDYVYLLNADTIIQPNTMQTMLAYLKAHPEVGAVTCRMEFPDHTLQMTCSRVPRYLDLLLGYTLIGALLVFWRNARRRAMWYTGWERDTTRAVEVIPDSNLLAPRQLLLDVGLYDETMKLYFTEDDLCRRILARGKAIHFVADALLLHYEHSSTEQVQRLATQVYFDDLLAYARKYYGWLGAGLLRLLIGPTRALMDIAQRLRGEKAKL